MTCDIDRTPHGRLWVPRWSQPKRLLHGGSMPDSPRVVGGQPPIAAGSILRSRLAGGAKWALPVWYPSRHAQCWNISAEAELPGRAPEKAIAMLVGDSVDGLQWHSPRASKPLAFVTPRSGAKLYNPAMVLLPSGRIAAFIAVFGRIHRAISIDGGMTWQKLGWTFLVAQDGSTSAVLLSNGVAVLAFIAWKTDEGHVLSKRTPGAFPIIKLVYTRDEGKSFEDLLLIQEHPSAPPARPVLTQSGCMIHVAYAVGMIPSSASGSGSGPNNPMHGGIKHVAVALDMSNGGIVAGVKPMISLS
ncbi:hypothetical protein CYMTET_7122 [Cymbomonas tetramitiformis]|uniref:Uncharacterized protein n=1 Tax=Cymbomonas tetramitiformis TaxID=36881 RepID=A0AAE0GVU5_9CHLO|nr:hypothetical protein CYMTET_7122 [Cymbomonas tetramitiformis]